MLSMISRLGLAISRIFRSSCPDPFTLAIFLTLLTAVLALLFGAPPATTDGEPQPRLVALLAAWSAADGLWKFLAFGMQMCLILITGHALACTRPVRRLIGVLADVPRTTASAAAMVGLVACLGGLINWGLGLIVGALLARDVGRSMSRRGIRSHYPLICAAGYMGLLVWHGGLSGSAPLAMTTLDGAAKVMPASWVDQRRAANVAADLPEETAIPLGDTIGSSMNLVISGGLLIGVPLLLMLLAPRRPDEMTPIDAYPVGESEGPPEDEAEATVPDRLDRSPIVAWLLAVPLLAAVFVYLRRRGLDQLDLNTINGVMLAAGLILHGSPRAYMEAVADGARGCAGIMVQFPLYGGIMGMMQAFGLVDLLARGFAAAGNQTTIPLLSYASAGVVNLFVPSGGGQWGIQGPIALETGLQAGIDPGTMVMAVAYGDQLTNMLQPFWALPLLAITGVRARDIVGYTAIVMVAAGVWMALGLVVLT